MAGRARRPWTALLLGLFLGFMASSWLLVPQVLDGRRQRAPSCRAGNPPLGRGPAPLSEQLGPYEEPPGQVNSSGPPPGPPRNFLYVGVMTAKKYVGSRAVAAYRTWARAIPGKVEFFSSSGSEVIPLPAPLPLVSLPGVDDAYPPQKKSFMMLKYIHDHYLDQFQWFMRADDDVYVRGEKLEAFLRSLNSSKPHYLGQTGLGVAQEVGRLALEPGENFCMGGPGMIFSREVLRRMGPFISTCLREMYTTHEDVEVGRCVRRFGGTQCVWSYEMQQLFYENYQENQRGFIEELHSQKILGAITLHPNKNPAYQYRLHSFLLGHEISRLRHRTLTLHREGLTMSSLSDSEVQWEDQQLGAPPSYVRYRPNNRNDVISWDFLTGRHIYSAVENNVARQNLGNPLHSALEDIVLQVMEKINQNSKTRGRVINFKEVQYGYYRVDPMHGAEYILDLLLLYKKHKGRKITVPVRRHAYLQQSFSRPFLAEVQEVHVAQLVAAINSQSFLSNSLRFLSPFQFYESTGELWEQSRRKVNILVPVSGRHDALVRFMDNFEKVCLVPQQNVKLSLVVVDGDSSRKQVELMEEYRRKYPRADLAVVPLTGNFSRGLALDLGSSQLHNNSLLFFCHVDLQFSAEALQRCRDNVAPGRRAYFPVVFSQYNPWVVYGEKPPANSELVMTQKSGFWRDYGFGIACMFKSDLVRSGGFDTSVLGGGLDDVDLFTKVVDSGLTVVRSQDPGLVHVYHPVHCNASRGQQQQRMCRGSKAGTLASAMQLAELWLEKHVRDNRTSS